MIDGLEPYPAMKGSGVPWLGEVPEHWRIETLKSSARNVIEQAAERRIDDLSDGNGGPLLIVDGRPVGFDEIEAFFSSHEGWEFEVRVVDTLE